MKHAHLICAALALISATAAVAALPAGYTQYSYIKGDGSSARIVMNDYTPTPNQDKIEAVVSFPAGTLDQSQCIWCARGASGANSWTMFMTISGGTNLRFDYKTAGTNFAASLSDTDVKYTFTAAGPVFTWSGGAGKTYSKVADYTADGPVMLFARYSDGVANNLGSYGKFKLYSFKVWRSDTLIHNLVPAVRESDSNNGLYDVVAGTFYAGTGTFTMGDKLLAETASPSPTFEVWTVDGAAYPIADAAAIAALPRVTWLAGDTVTATSCLGASSTLTSAAATAGSAAFAPNAGGTWTLENSIQGSARIGVPWTVFGDGGLLDSSAASPEFAVDAHQSGPDRKTKARGGFPVSYTGDHWAGGLESATLTFMPPSGEPTVLMRVGTGAEDFRFSVPGVWTVTLEMADGATLESRLTVAEDGLLIFVR